MHDIRWIRDNAAAFDAALASRGREALSSSLIALDDARKAAVSTLQAGQERRNAASKEIGQAMAARDAARADALKS
jgi:seryl-tRNA synthetase